MEQNIDDFFKQKIENIQDTLPETSTFDEAALWGNIQQDLHKPKRPIWYWLVPVAACLVAVLSWWILPHPALSIGEGSSTSVSPLHFRRGVGGEVKINVSNNIKPIKVTIKKKKEVEVQQRLDFKLERIASKNIAFSSKSINNLPDSLNFQSNIAFEKKPKVAFKIVHINEISKQGDVPFQQPRFKVQFAGKLFEKNESNLKETIQTPSIRIQ